MDLRHSVNLELLNLPVYNVTNTVHVLTLTFSPLSTINWSGLTVLVDIAWKTYLTLTTI